MNLQEYLAQENPVRNPVVELAKEDYNEYFLTNELKGISIKNLPFSYIKKLGENRLYTIDQQGNPRSLSCFYITD